MQIGERRYCGQRYFQDEMGNVAFMTNTLLGLLKIVAILVVLGIAAHISSAFMQTNPGSHNDIWGAVFFVLFLIFVFFIYFVPYSLAKKRNTVNKTIIFWINLLFGWTILGWCFALLLASTSQTVAAKEIEEETLSRLRKDMDNSPKAS